MFFFFFAIINFLSRVVMYLHLLFIRDFKLNQRYGQGKTKSETSLSRSQTVDKVGAGDDLQHHFSILIKFFSIFFKYLWSVLFLASLSARIFASFFRFIAAKVSPAFIFIRAFPIYCVYRK